MMGIKRGRILKVQLNFHMNPISYTPAVEVPLYIRFSNILVYVRMKHCYLFLRIFLNVYHL